MSVAVVGGGIIGLSVAWRLLRGGADVTVLDDGTPGAWHVAAGMLAPGGESEMEVPALGELMSRSAALWPSFASALGADVGYSASGTLSVAMTADDLAVASRSWRRRGLDVLRPSPLRELEPALSPRLRAGAFSPGDRQVDPRRVVAALRERLGRRVVNDKSVVSLSCVKADTVIVAAGCGTAKLTGLPVRPVKGQVLRLRGEPGLLRHVLDATVDGREVYVVPREDGRIVVGATQEERSDSTVTAGAVQELLRAALDLVPGLAEFAVEEMPVGHRPGTPDNAPLLGRLDERVIVAAGHHRNGVLLAPVTAELIAGLVLDGVEDPMLSSFAPGRFA